MFPLAPPPNHHVQFALKLSVRFTPPPPPKSPSLIYPQIAKSDLPLKSSVQFTLYPPPIAKSDLPSNRQVRFTPQIVCTIYPPPKIAKSDLPSNRQVRFTPQIICTIYPPKSPSPIYPQIAKSDLPLKSSVRFTPPPPIYPLNCQVRFTLKSPSPIYPSNRLYDLLPPNCKVRFTLKSPSPIYSNCLYDLPPLEIAKSDLPSNHQVRFTPPIYPSDRLYELPPFPPQIAKSDLQSSVRFTLKLSVWPPISQVWE